MSGPLPDALRPLTVPASWAYRRIIRRRNRGFDRGKGVRRVDVPVISVGNITTGGVGKTPMVAWLVEQLRDAGHRPLIAMRGYGARPGEIADEAAEYADRCPEIRLAVGADRYGAINDARSDHPDLDCVVLDDGFQHRGLHRDLDLVLIDAQASTMTDRLLPAGNLREPVESLARADAVIMTHASEVDRDLAASVASRHGRDPLAWTRHRWPKLRFIEGDAERLVEISWLEGRRVLTMLGVGRPHGIIRALEDRGATVCATVPARDHERYDRAKLVTAAGLCDGLDAMVLTGKDWVKVRDLIDRSTWPVPIVVPELRLEFLDGEPALHDLVLRTLTP